MLAPSAITHDLVPRGKVFNDTAAAGERLAVYEAAMARDTHSLTHSLTHAGTSHAHARHAYEQYSTMPGHAHAHCHCRHQLQRPLPLPQPCGPVCAGGES